MNDILLFLKQIKPEFFQTIKKLLKTCFLGTDSNQLIVEIVIDNFYKTNAIQT